MGDKGHDFYCLSNMLDMNSPMKKFHLNLLMQLAAMFYLPWVETDVPLDDFFEWRMVCF